MAKSLLALKNKISEPDYQLQLLTNAGLEPFGQKLKQANLRSEAHV